MRKTTTCLFWIALATLMSAPAALAAQEPKDNRRIALENKRIEAEFALAKSPAFYFVISLESKRIDLKSRGLVFRKWAARSVRCWGKPVSSETTSLARKSALVLPQRTVIKPGEEEAPVKPAAPAVKPGEFELEALEIKDMPKEFTLELEDGTMIAVVTKTKGLERFKRWVGWYIGMPLKTIKLQRKKQSMTLIQFEFDEPVDGQAMYWALTEGMRGLVHLTDMNPPASTN